MRKSSRCVVIFIFIIVVVVVHDCNAASIAPWLNRLKWARLSGVRLCCVVSCCLGRGCVCTLACGVYEDVSMSIVASGLFRVE